MSYTDRTYLKWKGSVLKRLWVGSNRGDNVRPSLGAISLGGRGRGLMLGSLFAPPGGANSHRGGDERGPGTGGGGGVAGGGGAGVSAALAGAGHVVEGRDTGSHCPSRPATGPARPATQVGLSRARPLEGGGASGGGGGEGWRLQTIAVVTEVEVGIAIGGWAAYGCQGDTGLRR